jgi:pimeloyl-ACP methyl ester carboxylesterase
MNSCGYVFIAGGGMSAWVWRDLEEPIRSRAVLVQGRLKSNDVRSRRRASLKDCVDHIMEQIEPSAPGSFIIVAHPGTGILAPLVAKRMPDKTKGIIFICANIPPHGASALSVLPLPLRVLNLLAVRAQLSRDLTPMRGHEKIIRRTFCNTAAEAVIEYVLEQDMQTEPLCAFQEKVDWNGVPKVRMAYVRLLEDRTASLGFQNRMAANLGITEFHDIASDHMVMLSHPELLNSAIHRLTESFCS